MSRPDEEGKHPSIEARDLKMTIKPRWSELERRDEAHSAQPDIDTTAALRQTEVRLTLLRA